MQNADVIIVGGGLAGLVAAGELAARGRKTIIVDQEGANSLGGQVFWSLGGLFMVNTPEQRRIGIRDSLDLATRDWFGSAGFDRPEDHWPKQWAKAYLEFAAGDMRPFLRQCGLRWLPIVAWAERGGSLADGHGNSVPRFHVTRGTGPAVLRPFRRRVRHLVRDGLVELHFRHRVTGLIVENGAVCGVTGEVLVPSKVARGERSSRDVEGEFELRADAVVVTSGGIGGNHELVRARWPAVRLGPAPERMLSGVPHYVDGHMLGVAEAAGAETINTDRMWHYVEGLRNWDPIWPKHGIRILPGPSSIWFDAKGNRLPAPCLPGCDTLSSLRLILASGYDYSWFVLTQKILEREFMLSGSEQAEPFAEALQRWLLNDRLSRSPPKAVEAFKRYGEDFVVAGTLRELVQGMNALGHVALDLGHIESQIEARDAQLANKYCKDAQIHAIHACRKYLGERLMRTVAPHRILDPTAGPLIAVRLNIITRKTLGGLHTDLHSRVLQADGLPFPGLFAAGEVAGFGGGGYHGYKALEGTFLGGCIFSGLSAGRNA